MQTNDRFTPALYSLHDEVALSIIRRNDRVRRTMRFILESESRVYDISFNSYIYAQQYGLSRSAGFKIFWEAFYEKYVSQADSIAKDPESIYFQYLHKYYWEMAKKEIYWVSDDRKELLDFGGLKEKWAAENAGVLSKRCHDLSAFLEAVEQ